MNITVIIPTKQRWEQLYLCLQSLFDSDKSSLQIEIYIGVHKPDDETFNLCQNHFPTVKIFEYEPHLTPGEIRNKLIDLTHPDYFLFIDDDTIVPKNYFLYALPYLKTQATVVGGPDLAVENSSFFQTALSLTQKSPMASAHTRYRHGSKFNANRKVPSIHDFILCNLWIHAKVFKIFDIKFPSGFKRNEENVLLFQISQVSQRFIFDDNLFIYHEKKKSVISIARAVYLSGFYRMKSFAKFPSSTSIAFLAPMFFMIYLISLSIFHSFIAFVPFFVFLFLVLFFSIKLTFTYRQGLRILFSVYFLHLMIILVYAIGTIFSLREICFEKNHSDSI